MTEQRSAASIDGTHADKGAVPFSQMATVKDVFYCFRLLLGRHPSAEEWRGHVARAGEDLTGVVASFAQSLECARRGLLDRDTLKEVVLTQLADFRLFSTRDDAAVGDHVRGGEYEPDVTAVFRRFLRPGMHVIDIGANIGYFSMLAAVLVGAKGSVLAVEPNPRNVRLLEASRRENGFDHVGVMQVAAGREPGLLVLNTSYSNGTTAPPPNTINAMLAAETVPCVRIDTLLPAAGKTDFIKIDAEGAEYNALLGCRDTIRRNRPIIVSEFSPSLMPGISGIDGEGYLRWLVEQGYELAVIQADGSIKPAGRDPLLVLQDYAARGSDHLDFVALASPAGAAA